jgi:hypothetical protein
MNHSPPQWDGTALSLQGTSHLATDKPCQDASGLVVMGETCVFVVADGAGSAQKSQLGSQTAVTAATEFLTEILAFWRPSNEPEWHSLLRTTMAASRHALEQVSASGPPMRDLYTTLLLVGMDSKCAAAANIGDCAAIVSSAAGDLVLLAPPQNGEYVNQTFFLTEPAWQENLQLSFLGSPPAYGVAFSDSLEFVALQRGQPFQGFVSKLVEQLKHLDGTRRAAALEQYFTAHVAGKRTDDDITFVAAWQSIEES